MDLEYNAHNSCCMILCCVLSEPEEMLLQHFVIWNPRKLSFAGRRWRIALHAATHVLRPPFLNLPLTCRKSWLKKFLGTTRK